jgi:hypothetical protein
MKRTYHIMKKQFLPFLIGLLLVVSAGMRAGAQTVIINTGTPGTPPAYNAGPIYRSGTTSAYLASRYTYLYTAAELAAAGITPGSAITSLGWIKNNTAVSNFPAVFNIYMKASADTSFSLASQTWANLNAGATLVFQDSSYIVPATAAPNYITFALSSPYIYLGGSIEISTEFSLTGGSSPYSSGTFDWLWSTVPDRIYGTGNTTIGPITTLSSTTNSISDINDRRPYIQISYIASAPCTTPPVAGTASKSVSSAVCPGTNVRLDLTGSSIGSGMTFQWESSATSGSGFTSTGASDSFPMKLNVSPVTTTFYRCAVTCSGTTTYTNEVEVTVNAPFPGGTYTINSLMPTGGTNFHSFTDAFDAIKCGITGPVVFDVDPASGPYTEQVSLPAMWGSSPTNSVTINGNDRTIQFASTASARHIIQLNGADYVTINNLRITGLDSTYGWGIHLMNGADHNTINNCVIDMSRNNSTTAVNSAGIVASGSTTAVTTAGNNANYLTITGDSIKGAYQGIIITGDAAARSLGNVIANNIVTDFYATGINVIQNDSAMISNNDISRAGRVTVGAFTGVELGAGNQRVHVSSNKIHDTNNSATSQSTVSYGVTASSCDAPVDSENVVSNNIIYNINSGTGTIYGLYNLGSDGIRYYHNTVVLNHAAATAGITRGFYQTTLASNIDIRNNIFYITRGGSGAKYCLYFNTATSSIVSNNNVLYINSPAGTNGIGYHGSAQNTLLAWRSVNGGVYDLQSTDVNPNFTSPATGDFTPSEIAVNNMGAAVGITHDITGAARTSPPDPGAIEFTPSITLDADITWVGPVSPAPSGLQDITVSILNNATTTITDLELAYTDGTTPVSETFSGLSIAAGNSQQITFTTQYNMTAATSFRAYITSVNGSTDGTQQNDSTLQRTVCVGLAGGTYTINSNLPTGSGNFNTFNAAVSALECGIMGPVVFNVAAGSGPYTERISIPQVTGSSATNTITFNGNGRTIVDTSVSATRAVVQLNGADYVTINNLRIVSASATYGWGVHLTGGADYNRINNCNINMSAVTSTTQANGAGIVISGSNTSVTTAGSASYNKFTGNTINGAYQGIIITGSATSLLAVKNEIVNNTIHDFYANGIILTQTDSLLVKGNNIHRANRAAVTTFVGIELGAGNINAVIDGNRIHDTHTSATTQSGQASGIHSTSNDAPVGSENRIINNVIYNFNSLTGVIYGLYNTGSDGVFYYNNTVVLDYAGSTSGTTRAFYQTTAAVNIDIKNNILSVSRGGTGAKHVLYFGTATSAITSNYNILHMNAPTGTNSIGYYSSNQNSLTDWKAVNNSTYDQQSIDLDPQFNGPRNYRPLATSPALGAGTPVSVTADIAGVTRSLTAPSIGAYETGGDFTGPVIQFGDITGTSSLANRTISGVTISDASDIDTAGNKPRIYYKKTTDDNTFAGNTSADNGWKWTATANTTSPFSFTIDYSLLTGGSVSLGDTVQYFIVAQDNAPHPNVGINDDGQFDNTPDSIDLTTAAFPVSGTIRSYSIFGSLAGTYTVGAAPSDFLNLHEVSEALRNNEITSDVIFELQPSYNGTTGETFPVVFDLIARTSPAYTVRIQPSASVAAPLVTAGDPGSGIALITLNQAQSVIFDGRPGGMGDTSNIMWTIRHTRTATTYAPTISFINNASYNTLEYLNIESGSTLTTTGAVLFSTSDKQEGNHHNIIRYNKIRNRTDVAGAPAVAIYSQGTFGAVNHHNEISHNRIFNWTSNGIQITATGNGDFWNIHDNSFFFDNGTATTAQIAINFLGASNNNTINNNYIGGNSFGAAGLWMNSGNNAFTGITASFDSTGTSSVFNNVITNIRKTGTGAASVNGIIITRGNANVHFNVIGDTVNPSGIINSGTGLFIGISVTNILANTVVNVDHNRIANVTNGTGIIRGISYTAASVYPQCNVRYNHVFGLSTNSVSTGYAGGSITGQGIYYFPSGYPAPSEMIGNTVYGIRGNSTTAATNIAGITATNFQGRITNNLVYDIQNAAAVHTPVPATANGMFVRFLENTLIANNMIALNGNISDSVQMNGIMITGANGGTQMYVHNTVYISNSTGGSPVTSFAFHRGENSTTTQSFQPVVLKNNIFYNNVSAGGSHYAVGNEGARPDSSWIIAENDYNNFFSLNPATLTLWGGTQGDLSLWQSQSNSESHSISHFTQFIDPSTADLHLTGTSLGDFLLAGTPVSMVNTDFDGDIRHAGFPYMGADESTGSPLPVNLSAFSAKRTGSKDVLVYWTTASEVNAEKFVIEASANGKDFVVAGTVKATGESAAATNYQFTHYNVPAAMNNAATVYYRLTSVDKDGKSSLSEIVKVSFNKEHTTSALEGASAYPNPFSGDISISIPFDKAADLSLEIMDIQGRVITTASEKLSTGANNVMINNLDSLNRGIYFIRMSANGEHKVIKMIKE